MLLLQGVNAITGVAKDGPTPPDVEQDYVVVGLQPWLDGVVTEPGVVRQVCCLYSITLDVYKLIALLQQPVCSDVTWEKLYSGRASNWEG